jgi:hypothetical protein
MRGAGMLERMTGQALFGDMAISLSTMKPTSYGQFTLRCDGGRYTAIAGKPAPTGFVGP